MNSFWNELPKPFFILAPMEAVTDVVFRHVVAKAGRPDVFFTEFVSTDGYCSPKGKHSTRGRLAFSEDEHPMVAQIWGDKPEHFREMAHGLKELGYKGKLTLVRNFLRRLSIKPDEEKIIRFETPPGMQAQVDWTTMQRGKLYAFIMILGFSRFAYVEFVEKTDLKQLLVCHENAFEFFGGTCRDLLYDNMKTVVIERDRYGSGKHGFQQAFWDFSKHWGFLPRLCRPYRAQTKGKVERFIGYMKRSFYYPLVTKEKDIDLCSLNFEVKKWLLEIAAKRFLKERASTPEQLFSQENQHLLSLVTTYFPSHHKGRWQEDIVQPHNLAIYEKIGVWS